MKKLTLAVVSLMVLIALIALADTLYKRPAYVQTDLPTGGNVTLRYQTTSCSADYVNPRFAAITIYESGEYAFCDSSYETAEFLSFSLVETTPGSLITSVQNNPDPVAYVAYSFLPGNTGDVLTIADGDSTPLHWADPDTLFASTAELTAVISDLAGATADAAALKIYNEQLGTSAGALAPFVGAALNTGTLAGIAATADHPGTNTLKASTVNNSGYTLYLSSLAFVAGAEDKMTLIFKTANAANGNNRWRMGYDSSTSIADGSNGAWLYFDQAAGTIAGKSQDAGGGVQTTGTAYSYADATWYRGEIEIDGDGDTIVYTIYTCSDGASVWSDSLGTVPTGTVFFGVTTWNTAPVAALVIVTLDMLELDIRRTLAR